MGEEALIEETSNDGVLTLTMVKKAFSGSNDWHEGLFSIRLYARKKTAD